MSTKQQEQLHTQTNAGEHHKSKLSIREQAKEATEEIVERERIDGTPFWVEGNEETGYFLRMGRHRLTIEEIKTKEEAVEYINYNMYDLLLKMVLAVMADRDEIAELRTDTKILTTDQLPF